MTFDGSWQERYEADKESCWDNITTSDIVYFSGTKIIGTSPDGLTDIHILDDPSDGHGTAVTGAVLDANPDAVIFFVEGFSTEAVLAASNQPLVDIISTSFGAIGSLPVPGIETGTYEAVVGNNKIHTEQRTIRLLLQFKMLQQAHLGRLVSQDTLRKETIRRRR